MKYPANHPFSPLYKGTAADELKKVRFENRAHKPGEHTRPMVRGKNKFNTRVPKE